MKKNKYKEFLENSLSKYRFRKEILTFEGKQVPLTITDGIERLERKLKRAGS